MGKCFFIFGAGYSGLGIAAHIAAVFGGKTRIFGTARLISRLPALQAAGITPLIFDGQKLDAAAEQALAAATHLIVSIPPQAEQSDLVLALPALAQKMPNVQWLCYLSTLGVYGDTQGAWLDETAPLRPSSARSQARQKAEAAWQAFAAAHNLPCAVLRLGALYGGNLAAEGAPRNSRNPFTALAAGTARCIIKQGQVFNRIHVDDIGGAVCRLAADKIGGIFNLCDSCPAPPQDFIRFAAKLAGKEPPPEEDYAAAALSPAWRSFYQDNRRAANAKLLQSGYRLLYPDYKSGLTKIWQSRNW